MVSFSQRQFGFRYRLGSWAQQSGRTWWLKTGLPSGASPSPAQLGSLSHGSEAEQQAGGAGTAAGPLWSEWIMWWRRDCCSQEWSVQWRQLAILSLDCWCPVCPCRAVTVSGGGQASVVGTGQGLRQLTSPFPAPLSPPRSPWLLFRSWFVAAGCPPGLGGCVNHQAPLLEVN